jgi:effector-binding domain-containing protein
MLAPLQIIETTAQITAVIHFVVPREDIQAVMGPAIQEVLHVLAAQAIPPSGPVFCHHLRTDPKLFDFEVGVPTATRVHPEGRVIVGVLPSTTIAQTVYRGGYERLAAAWSEFDEMLKANGYSLGEDLWERYLVGPESGGDASAWLTELNRPISMRA